jgi:hypothetical protein
MNCYTYPHKTELEIQISLSPVLYISRNLGSETSLSTHLSKILLEKDFSPSLVLLSPLHVPVLFLCLLELGIAKAQQPLQNDAAAHEPRTPSLLLSQLSLSKSLDLRRKKQVSRG